MKEVKIAKKARQAEYDAKPEVKAAKRAYETEWKARPENKVARKTYDLNKKYGLSMKTYDEMLIESCGKCVICNKPFNNYIKEPTIDHNHTTGKVRGLLHAKCNKALGLFDEDLTTFLNAIKYLTLWSD